MFELQNMLDGFATNHLTPFWHVSERLLINQPFFSVHSTGEMLGRHFFIAFKVAHCHIWYEFPSIIFRYYKQKHYLVMICLYHIQALKQKHYLVMSSLYHILVLYISKNTTYWWVSLIIFWYYKQKRCLVMICLYHISVPQAKTPFSGFPYIIFRYYKQNHCLLMISLYHIPVLQVKHTVYWWVAYIRFRYYKLEHVGWLCCQSFESNR